MVCRNGYIKKHNDIWADAGRTSPAELYRTEKNLLRQLPFTIVTTTLLLKFIGQVKNQRKRDKEK